MTNETLANYANLSLYSAMAVLTISMIAYAVYLAGVMPARDARAEELRESARERELVAAGSGASGAAERSHSSDAIDAADSDAAVSTARGSAARATAAREAADLGVPVRARKAAGMANTLSILGTLLLVSSAVMRGASVDRWPLGNMFEFAVVAAMFTMIVFCVWGTRRDLRWLGLFVTAPVLILLGLAITVWYTEAAELMPSLKSVWLAIHVTVATISVALFAVGFVVALLYLAKDRFGEDRGVLRVLPPGKALERLAYGLHIVAFPLWTFTLIAGAIWARQAWGAYWNWDPKEVWTFIIWVVYAAYLHARVTRGWRRQSATWVAVAGFVCIILNYAVVNVYFVGQHSYSGL